MRRTTCVFTAESTIDSGRRAFSKYVAAGVVAMLLSTAGSVPAVAARTTAAKKTLIVYFSRSGNTRMVAGQIQAATGGELLELRTATPYPEAYDEVARQAKQELESGYRPPLQTKIPDFSAYDRIFVGSPNWWGTFAAPVKTFLTENDLTGKTVAPFITHQGSRLGRAVEDIKALCPKAIVLPGLAVRGPNASSAQQETETWLRRNGLMN